MMEVKTEKTVHVRIAAPFFDAALQIIAALLMLLPIMGLGADEKPLFGGAVERLENGTLVVRIWYQGSGAVLVKTFDRRIQCMARVEPPSQEGVISAGPVVVRVTPWPAHSPEPAELRLLTHFDEDGKKTIACRHMLLMTIKPKEMPRTSAGDRVWLECTVSYVRPDKLKDAKTQEDVETLLRTEVVEMLVPPLVPSKDKSSGKK